MWRSFKGAQCGGLRYTRTEADAWGPNGAVYLVRIWHSTTYLPIVIGDKIIGEADSMDHVMLELWIWLMGITVGGMGLK